MSQTLSAQTLTTLFTFNYSDGGIPAAPLVQATNGDFFGTTAAGGENGQGTIFRISPSGALTTLYNFCSQGGYPACTDGASPGGGMVQATNGDLYGMTAGVLGGSQGTVYRITPSGDLTTLVEVGASGTLIQGANGNLYGISQQGVGGTIFEMTPGGTLSTLYTFCAMPDCPDGYLPVGGLFQASNGDFYGVTSSGGVNYNGTIFKITPGGTLTTLYSFCAEGGICADGSAPFGGLVQARNGEFYGTTSQGGVNGGGTVFKISPDGALVTLHSFCSDEGNCATGYEPSSALALGTDGNLYGTNPDGGAEDDGTIFRITPSGTFTTLHAFCTQGGGVCTDGAFPLAGLIQGTNGAFYGTTGDTPSGGAGTVFRLSVGLGPFIETQTKFGKVGAAVKILGTNLTGTTVVTFNGIAATFDVVSAAEITTTVPMGGTSGMVQVITPNGTLSSNVAFQVVP